MPDITVVTAAHLDSPDKIRWLREAADSIIRQSFEDWEWVVVDDASPSGPDLPGDVRIRVVRAHERSGPAKCRNVAAALARSPCLLPLDADDMLAGTGTLELLLRTWEANTDRFVYGDLQLWQDDKAGKVVHFPEYDFVKSLDPKGIVPVSAAHSLECWHRAGGWKPAFDAGLEDVEYWISAGKAGFCGLRVDEVALLYRRHPGSRTARMRAALRQDQMEKAIRDLHPDVYEGRLPVGCCGSKKRSTTNTLPVANRVPVNLAAPAGNLSGGMVWVQYNGGRMAEFQVKGQATGVMYSIKQTGEKFQVWAQDAAFFSSLGRGKDFTVGVSPPKEAEPTPVPEPVEEAPEYDPPPPEVTVIERLDPVARAEIDLRDGVQPEEKALAEETLAQARREEAGIKLARIDAVGESVDPREYEEAARDEPLEDVESLTAEQRAMLETEGWTLPKLAAADPEDLVPYPTIGKVTAARAIAEANRLWPK